MSQKRVLVSGIPSVFNADGTSARARRVLEALRPYFEVHLVTKGDRFVEVPFIERDKTYLLKPENSRLWPTKLIPFILKNSFDVIICEDDPYGFILYWLFSRLRGQKVIYEAHGILSEQAKWRGERPAMVRLIQTLERFCIKNADFVVALSEGIEEEYRKFNSQISFIPVFLERFPSRFDFPSNFRKRSKCVGVIGPFGTARNRHTLDFIYTHINEFSDDVGFVVVGKCEKRIEHPRISYSGYVQRLEQYYGLLGSLDAVIVVERIATSGPLTKILEPMMLGVPVITTPKGAFGISHLKSHENIIIAEEEDIVGILNIVLSDKPLLEFIGENARKFVDEHYCYEINAKKLVSVVRQVIGSE